ncbi:MAG: phospholipase D-like domain-containing protein [Cellvibrionaceae bacterium]
MLDQLKQQLVESLDDNKLDNDEKSHFYEVMTSLTGDQKRYVRNQAFDLARDKVGLLGDDSAQIMRVMGWLERVVKLVDKSLQQATISSRSYFSPGRDCRDGILYLLTRARQRIDICVFTISDDRITQSIIDAHDKQVPVRVLTDNDKANDRGSDVYRLQDYGIPVVMDTSPSHMHHKFALVDDYLLNGSFNWTRSASERNQENIVISDNPTLIRDFDRTFNELWAAFSQ